MAGEQRAEREQDLRASARPHVVDDEAARAAGERLRRGLALIRFAARFRAAARRAQG